MIRPLRLGLATAALLGLTLTLAVPPVAAVQQIQGFTWYNDGAFARRGQPARSSPYSPRAQWRTRRLIS